MIVTLVYIEEDNPAESTTDYSAGINAISRNDESERQKDLKHQQGLQHQMDNSEKIAMEIEDRVRCREATLAPVDVVKDESFSAAADSISAKIGQDDLIEACMLAKGWPKK